MIALMIPNAMETISRILIDFFSKVDIWYEGSHDDQSDRVDDNAHQQHAPIEMS